MNKFIQKNVATVVAGSLLTQACVSPYYNDGPIEETYVRKKAEKNPSTLLPVDVEISQEDVEYLNFLLILANDIVRDSSIANSFISNPESYIVSKGFDVNSIYVDSDMTKIILALSDSHICSAIQNQDIPKYLTLMKERGLLDQLSIQDLDVNLSSLNQIAQALGFSSEQEEEIVTFSFPFFFLAVVVGVGAVVWAVVAEHLAFGNAVAAGTAIIWTVGAVTENKHKPEEGQKVCTTLKIWDIKSQDVVSTILSQTVCLSRKGTKKTGG